MNEVALAKALIAARIERAKRSAQPVQNGTSAKKGDSAPLSASALPSASRALLDPAAYDRLLSQLNEVAPSSVKSAAKKLLARDHRVVVLTAPAKKPVEPKTP